MYTNHVLVFGDAFDTCFAVARMHTRTLRDYIHNPPSVDPSLQCNGGILLGAFTYVLGAFTYWTFK